MGYYLINVFDERFPSYFEAKSQIKTIGIKRLNFFCYLNCCQRPTDQAKKKFNSRKQFIHFVIICVAVTVKPAFNGICI
jgi:hypothetical protein